MAVWGFKPGWPDSKSGLFPLHYVAQKILASLGAID